MTEQEVDRRPQALIPPSPTVEALREAAQLCQGCDLWRNATQAVFGEGGPEATVMLVGEQPGDREDLSGHPFVGPAGKLLDRALEEAGIERDKVYVTNAVKHFKWMPRGKKRLHKKPNAEEIAACRPWLDAEIALIGPELVVCLGATAAQALLGRAFRVTESHGQILDGPGDFQVMATMHPSSILRAQSDEDREAQMRVLVEDLTNAARFLRG
ncbi:MAG: UdgX family uracil-DNA binding protein [Actinomycetota bacterium]|nr:UdgX family uracil-DNA binding protein [Actinomycetota bacterium]